MAPVAEAVGADRFGPIEELLRTVRRVATLLVGPREVEVEGGVELVEH